MLTRLVTLALGLTLLVCGAAAADERTPGSPASYDDLPVGAPTSLPWWQRGRLHLGDTVIRTDRSDIASRNGTTVVGSDPLSRMGRDTWWYLVVGQEMKRLPMRARAAQPLISADGRWLAWRELRAPRTDAYRRVERYRVVVYDVGRQRIANSFRDRRVVAWEDGGNGIWLRTLSNDGRLVLSRGSDGVQVLSPSGRPIRFAGAHVGNGVDLDGWPSGTTIFGAKRGVSIYGFVGTDGAFERRGSFTESWSGLWSPDGERYAYTDDSRNGTLRVRSLDGATVRLGVPTELEYDLIGWESADAVVLWPLDGSDDSRDREELVRCSATTGACEQVPGGPRARGLVAMPSRY